MTPMDPQIDEKDFDAKLAERFKQLPPVMQNAIMSAGVEDKLRELSEKHKLHLDQWEALENEVMLTLFGFQPAEDLAQNLEKETGIGAEAAAALAGDIGEAVFLPIREELQRETEAPGAPSTPETPPAAPPPIPMPPTPPASIPSTPPPPPPAMKVERAPTSPSYAPQTKSHERAAIDDDPYREPIA